MNLRIRAECDVYSQMARWDAKRLYKVALRSRAWQGAVKGGSFSGDQIPWTELCEAKERLLSEGHMEAAKRLEEFVSGREEIHNLTNYDE